MACRECHLAKVKCDNKTNPCARCARLSLKCVRHMSRQGHGRKERRRQKKNPDDSMIALPSAALLDNKPVSGLEDDVARRTCKLAPGHYGLNCLIRTWIGYAITRRSTSLMARAFSLATKCSISLDQILCGENDFAGEHPMDFLAKCLLLPARQQEVTGERLTLSEISDKLLEAVNGSAKEAELRHPENRWVYMRERRGGTDRHYVSGAFERDIATWQTIQDTWKANKTEVFNLWLTTWEEKLRYSQGLIHQFSLHNVKGVPLAPARIRRTKLRLATKKEIEVDCIVCIEIANLDHGYLWVEFFKPLSDEERAAAIAAKVVTSNGEMDPSSSADDGLDFLLNIAEVEWTKDLEEIMQAGG